jgi:hypothetical protein
MSAEKIFHVRVEHTEFNMFTFYNVRGWDKSSVERIARNKFSEDFKIPIENTEIGYVWDPGIHVDIKKDPPIN